MFNGAVFEYSEGSYFEGGVARLRRMLTFLEYHNGRTTTNMKICDHDRAGDEYIN